MKFFKESSCIPVSKVKDGSGKGDKIHNIHKVLLRQH